MDLNGAGNAGPLLSAAIDTAPMPPVGLRASAQPASWWTPEAVDGSVGNQKTVATAEDNRRSASPENRGPTRRAPDQVLSERVDDGVGQCNRW